MTETKHERYLRLKKEKQMKALKAANKNLQKTVAVVGATTVAGLALAPKSHAYTVPTNQVQTPAQRFLNKIIPAAQQATEGKDVYTSVMIAQAALESAWGTSVLASEPNHNLFGVKGNYNGQSVNMYTLEDAGAQNYYGIYDNFRKYPSYKESMDDYVDKIVNGIKGAPMFYSGAWKSRTNSYQDATRYLTGRYATDTAYYAKLNRIIEQFGLTKYDNGNATAIAASTEEKPSIGGQYTVQAGDTLYAISRKLGVSVNQLLSLNGLSLNSVIHPGQSLSLGNSTNKITTTVVSTPVNTSSVAKVNGTYTVKAGDTLYSIARRSGMSLNSLLTLNGLSQSSVIYPGQSLTVSQSEGNFSTSVSNKTNNASSVVSTSGTYTVKAGDTLYSIARRSGVSLSSLLSLNGLSQSSVIRPGQKINISGASNTTVATPVSSTSQATSTSGTYTVKAGDTLYRIAHNHGISLRTLLSVNGLSETSTIRPGQQLVVSGSAQATASYSSTQAVSSGAKTHTVKAGEGLWRIARTYGLSLEQLKSLNGLTSNVIRVGQVLKVSK